MPPAPSMPPDASASAARASAAALGFDPQYLLVTVSPPRDGHCYKVCAAVLPRG